MHTIHTSLQLSVSPKLLVLWERKTIPVHVIIQIIFLLLVDGNNVYHQEELLLIEEGVYLAYLNKDIINIFNSTINEGKIYEIGHLHHSEIPHHPAHSPFMYSLSRMHGDIMYADNISSANDLITTGTHTGTHIDGLGHISCSGLLHGDIPVEDNQSKTKGLQHLGIHTIEPMIKKAKLLDIATTKNISCLEAGYEITVDDLQCCIEMQEITIEQGDAVFIRTGWATKVDNAVEFLSHDKGVPGMSVEGAKYLAELGMALTGSDTTAYEVSNKGKLPVHGYLLVEKGIHIVELLDFEELARDKKYEFLFICLPLRILGATGSPIRPIAIV